MRGGLPERRSRAAYWARFAGALAVPVLAIEAIGVRTGTLPPDAILPVLALGITLAVVALCLGIYALVDIWRMGSQGLGAAAAGIIYAAPVLILLAAVAIAAVWYPPINDVSTDVENPPVLSALAEGAEGAFAPDVAALQVSAYPELTPAIYPLPVAQVYSAARTLIEDRGWLITSENPPPGLENLTAPPATPQQPRPEPPGGKETVLTQSRAEATGAAPASSPARQANTGPAVIEAVARTPLFGFADLVTLRMTPTPEGTLLDMRSASQVGRHDLGQNARRIRAFLAELDAAIQTASVAPPPAAPAPEEPAASESPVAEADGEEADAEPAPPEEQPAGE